MVAARAVREYGNARSGVMPVRKVSNLRGRLKSNLNLVLVLFMGIIDKAWDEHNRTIPERFYRERMEADRAFVARAEDVWTTAALSAAQSH